MRLAGRFLLFSEDRPASKKIFEKFSKRRLLAGSERCQFDAYCKLVLYHEAIDYLREMQRRRDTVSYPYL